MSVEPVSTNKSNAAGRGCLVLFGSVFLFAGLLFLWFMAISPLLKSRSSGNWIETQCRIVKSEIRIDRDDDSTTYRPDVEFEYNFDGQNYVSDTYDFTSLNRSQDRCREIVEANTIGQQTSCYVNPNSPDEAVIVRDYDFSYIGIIFPSIFALIGLGVICSALFFRSSKQKSISGSTTSPSHGYPLTMGLDSKSQLLANNLEHPGDEADQLWDEPKKLHPEQSRLAKLIGILFFGVLWNGFVSFFVYMTLTDGAGGLNWIPLLFLVPFILVGLGLIGGAIYLFAALFNPQVELALSTGAVARGDTVDIAWQLNDKSSRVSNLKIAVEGEESATYRRGTDTITDTNVFLSLPVIETSAPESIEFGSESIQIPADTMHSFTAGGNRIAWRFVVTGEIAMWPNINERFEFRVKP